MLTYIRLVKFNVFIPNRSKSPVKGFGLVVVKTPKTNIIIPLWLSYYMPQNPQNKMSQTELKHYNKFRSIRNEAVRWLQITKHTQKKLKVGMEVKERDQQLL